MDFRSVDIGKWHKVDTIVIKDAPLLMVGRNQRTTYTDCHVKFVDGWCLIEVRETDGEGSVDIYPADQIAAAFNVHEADQTDGPTAHFV